MKYWKEVFLEFGTEEIRIEVPESTDVLTMQDAARLPSPGTEIEKSLDSGQRAEGRL